MFHAPDWFVQGLPRQPLDGELWLGRKKFQRTVSIVRRQDKSDHWKEIRFVVFDAPGLEKTFEARVEFIKECLTGGSRPSRPGPRASALQGHRPSQAKSWPASRRSAARG